MARKKLNGYSLILDDGVTTATMTRAQLTALLLGTGAPAHYALPGFFLGEPVVTTAGQEIEFIVPGDEGMEWEVKFAQITRCVGGGGATTNIRIADGNVAGSPAVAHSINLTAAAVGAGNAIEPGAEWIVEAGDIIYAFITTADGFQDFQFLIHLEEA